MAFVDRCGARRLAGAGGRPSTSVEVEGTGPIACAAVAVAGGAWTAAMGEWFGRACPSGPTKGQIVHLGVGARRGEWPIVQPLLSHYLVPWPGGRVACGGTFEAGAGFSITVTAAGLHELLRECLAVAPGLEGADLPRDPGRAAAHHARRPRPGRAVPGWGNAFVATGHGANGLLQGPYSSRGLAHAITGARCRPDEPPLPGAFDPARFA